MPDYGFILWMFTHSPVDLYIPYDWFLTMEECMNHQQMWPKSKDWYHSCIPVNPSPPFQLKGPNDKN